MAGRQESRETATPVVMGEKLDPPKYGEKWNEEASRVFFAAYREYKERVEFANAQQVVRSPLMGVNQLIPVFVQRCFGQHYYQRRKISGEELMIALQQHAGYSTTGGEMLREQAAADIRRVTRMPTEQKNVKDRIMTVISSLEKYFSENPSSEALYRAENGEYLPGPAEKVSVALIDGISPPEFRARVRTEIGYIDGKETPSLFSVVCLSWRKGGS